MKSDLNEVKVYRMYLGKCCKTKFVCWAIGYNYSSGNNNRSISHISGAEFRVATTILLEISISPVHFQLHTCEHSHIFAHLVCLFISLLIKQQSRRNLLLKSHLCSLTYPCLQSCLQYTFLLTA